MAEVRQGDYSLHKCIKEIDFGAEQIPQTGYKKQIVFKQVEKI